MSAALSLTLVAGASACSTSTGLEAEIRGSGISAAGPEHVAVTTGPNSFRIDGTIGIPQSCPYRLGMVPSLSGQILTLIITASAPGSLPCPDEPSLQTYTLRVLGLSTGDYAAVVVHRNIGSGILDREFRRSVTIVQ
jgi:hypothetical protein